MRILLVDDDPSILQLIKLTLNAMGYSEVETATDAAQASLLTDRAKEPFECILLDIQMPGMDGIDFCKWLRERPLYKYVPIIMLTAMSDRHYIDRAFSVGATDYLTKPFETIELKARLLLAEQRTREVLARLDAEQGLASAIEQMDFGPAVDFEDALHFDDMPGHLEFHAFQNLLELVKRDNAAFGGLAAIKIADVSSVYKRLPNADYLNFVTDMSDAISQVLEGTESFFSYSGSGYFLLVADGKFAKVLSKGFEAILQKAVTDMGLCYPDGSQIRSTLIMGAFQGQSRLRACNVSEMIQAAISDTEIRIAARTKVHVLPTEFRRDHPLRLYGGLKSSVA